MAYKLICPHCDTYTSVEPRVRRVGVLNLWLLELT